MNPTGLINEFALRLATASGNRFQLIHRRRQLAFSERSTLIKPYLLREDRQAQVKDTSPFSSFSSFWQIYCRERSVNTARSKDEVAAKQAHCVVTGPLGLLRPDISRYAAANTPFRSSLFILL
jgi:hypothetical protein